MPFPVVLRLYDLSHGMARELSPSLLGQQIDGIWHTGVFVYGREYFYGGGGAGAGTESGISSARGSEFSLNQGIRPVKEIPLGTTNKSQQEFESFLQRIAGRFRVCDYSLFHHNCNNFSDAVSQFLVGHPIPEYITGLPARVLATPMGAALQPLMDNFNNNFQTQIATPQSQQSLRHYGAESTTAPPVPAHDGARGNDEAEAQAALDAALAAMSDPLESSTTTSTTTTTTTAARPDGSTTTTTKSETVVTSTTRPSACPLSVFDDRSLVPGMVRRLTNLGSHFMSVHPNFDAVLKAAFIALQKTEQQPLTEADLTALRALAPILVTVLESRVPRALLPAAYLVRLLCLFDGLFDCVVAAAEAGFLSWCNEHLPRGALEQIGGVSPVAAMSIRATIYAALSNLCSRHTSSEGTQNTHPVRVVRKVLYCSPQWLGSLADAAAASIVPKPPTPNKGLEAQGEAERAACLALLSNIAIQVSAAAAAEGPTRNDSRFQEQCRHVALELLKAAACPLAAEEQATLAAVRDNATPPLRLLMPPGARRDATEICTELLHCPALVANGKREVRQAIQALNLVAVARGNARRMAAAASAGGEGAQERREKSQLVSGAFFVQVMAMLNE